MDDLLAEAHSFYDRWDYAAAQKICEQINARYPSKTENLLLLGAINYQLRNLPAAIECNRRALAIDPRLAEAHGNLGNCLKDKGDMVGAIRSYEAALDIKPSFTDAHTNLAAAYAENSQFHLAILHYQKALELQPQHTDALNNLGNLFKHQGQLNEARDCYIQAISYRPNFAAAHSNLASVYRDQGLLDLALQHFALAITHDPNLADAYSNMGNVYKDMGKWDLAQKCYEQAIVLRPTFAIAHGNLASVFVDRGEYDRAIVTYLHAIALDGTQPDFYDNIGLAYRGKGELADATTAHQHALALNPNRAHTCNNLGNVLKERGLLREAMEAYLTALQLAPQFAAAHSNLANVYREQGRHQLAIDHYRAALELNPMFADAYSNMGNVFKDQGRMNEAIEYYRKAISLNPNFADAHSNLASVYKDTGKLTDAIDSYRHALTLKPFFPDAFCNLLHCLQMICAWRDRDVMIGQLYDTINKQLAMGQAPSVQPHHALVYPLDRETILMLSKAYAAQVKRNAACFPPLTIPHARTLSPEGRIRIGYVSSDFGNHPLSDLMGSVFGMHDRTRFEVFCFALLPDDGHRNYARIRSEVEHFIDISAVSIEQSAALVNAQQIHILINLNGYTKGARNELFALQPAPIQVSYMGFPGTTGADFIQYLITDRITSPPETQNCYTEFLAYMPHCYFVTDYKQSFRFVLDPAQCPTRAQIGLPEDKFVFYCANQLYKIDQQTFDVWCNILKRVPNSVLWLLRFPPIGEPFVLAEAHARGIEPGRIIFTDQAIKEMHLKRSTLADLFLDTPVCNGHTTACDVLWAGVPIVTMPLEKMASRVAASVVANLGCPEMIVNSYADYENLAVQLATTPQMMAAWKHKVRSLRETAPLFDTALWVKEVEAVYTSMWNIHASGAPPRTFEQPLLQ
eukprot:TRINITY_DN9239_c0_g1_i1.p1 TRINITY_DN9239_c0_g1~~TRINITY_DN9239_c0_g1_i1.p1  ORF type:complete len:943 (-),score=155.89 TRINITY_DN9239_c0_g1_i1:1066-3804(-)